MIDLEETFETFEDEYLMFKRVENKLHNRRDLCAFLLLDKLVPGKRNMVSCAEHDEIFFGIDCDKLAEIATEDDILTLVRCGVWFNEDGLAMFA